MKWILFPVLSCLLSVASFSQKIVEHPRIRATTANNVKVVRVVLTDTATVMDFEVHYIPGQWIRIGGDETFIRNSRGGKQLYVTGAHGISLDARHPTPESGVNLYTLVFPPVGEDIEFIDYMEPQWKILGIDLAPDRHPPVIPEPIRGNWFRTDGSNEWAYGFYENTVVCDNECWTQLLVTSKGKNYTLSLNGDNRHETVLVKRTKKGLLIGTDNKHMELFSRERTDISGYPPPDDNEFSPPVFRLDTAVYKGFIKGYDPVLGSVNSIYASNIILHKENEHYIDIRPDGTFEARIPMYYPHEVYVMMAGIGESVFLEPGKTTFHFIDLFEYTPEYMEDYLGRDPGKEMLFMGDNARINVDLKRMESIDYYAYGDDLDSILGMSAEEYKSYHMKVLTREQDSLEAFAAANRVSKKALQIKRIQLPCRKYGVILSYRETREAAYRRKYNVPREKIDIPLEFRDPQPEYYDFLDRELLNDPVSVVVGYPYGTVIDYLRLFYKADQEPGLVFRSMLDSINRQGIEVSQQDREILDTLLHCGSTECVKQVVDHFGTAWVPFYKRYGDMIRDIGFTVREMNRLEIIEKYFGISGGFVRDLVLAQAWAERIYSWPKEMPPEEKDQIRKEISDDFMVDFLIRMGEQRADVIVEGDVAGRYRSGHVAQTVHDAAGDAADGQYHRPGGGHAESLIRLEVL